MLLALGGIMQKRNWALITERVMEAANVSAYKLALMLNTDHRTVKHWRDGKTVPPHHQGEALLSLYTKYWETYHTQRIVETAKA
jgi:hypothetical protein